MIESAFGLAAVIVIQLSAALFGYYTAMGHVRRMLDIEEPEEPAFVQNARNQLRKDGALTPDDIDEIDDWDEVWDDDPD